MRLQWDEVAIFNLGRYEVRLEDANWGVRNDQLLKRPKDETVELPISAAGPLTLYVKAIRQSGTYSENAASVTITIAAPLQPSLASRFDAESFALSWTEEPGDFPIAYYDVRRGGGSFSDATPVDTLQARELKVRADWSGTETWRGAAVDVAGNTGAAGSLDVQVAPPSKPPNFRSKVFGEDVLLFWDSSTGTLPIDYYQIVRDDAADAALGDGSNEAVARSSGTFGSLTEANSGTFAYWVQPFDTAGNGGTAAKLTAFVDEPADFLLQSQFDPDFSGGTRTNLALEAVETQERDHLRHPLALHRDLRPAHALGDGADHRGGHVGGDHRNVIHRVAAHIVNGYLDAGGDRIGVGPFQSAPLQVGEQVEFFFQTARTVGHVARPGQGGGIVGAGIARLCRIQFVESIVNRRVAGCAQGTGGHVESSHFQSRSLAAGGYNVSCLGHGTGDPGP